MAIFTTISKNRLSYPATIPDTTAYFLKISDTYFLDIGSGYKLQINKGPRTPNVWNKITKTR